MNKYKFIPFLVSFLVLTIIFTNKINSQTITQAFEGIASDIIEPYAAPATNPFGANLNSGWLNRVPAPEIAGFSFSFGFYAMASKMGTDNNTYDAGAQFFLTRAEATDIVVDQVTETAIHQQIIDQLVDIPFFIGATGSTINGFSQINGMNLTVGSAEDLVFEVTHPDYPFPVELELEQTENITIDLDNYLAGINYLPTAVPQFAIGTVYGTEAILRFTPTVEVDDDIGEVGFFAIGLLHNPKVWFDYELPIDFSVGFLSQKISLGDKGDITSFSAGLHVRKEFDFGWVGLAPFASFATESTTFDLQETKTFNTDFGEHTVNLKFKFDAENTARAALGTVFNFAFLDLTFSYHLAKHNVLVGGLTFNFDFFN